FQRFSKRLTLGGWNRRRGHRTPLSEKCGGRTPEYRRSLWGMSERMYSTDHVHEVDTGSFTISYQVRVGADTDQLWLLAANPHRHHELDGSGSLSTNVTGPEQLSEGDTFNIWMRRFGLPYTLKMTVVTAER